MAEEEKAVTTNDLLSMDVQEAYNLLHSRNPDVGWLRKAEGLCRPPKPGEKRNPQFSLEEKTKVMALRRYLHGVAGLANYTKIVADAWGTNNRTIQNWDRKGTDFSRKERSDKGTNSGTSTNQQEHSITPTPGAVEGGTPPDEPTKKRGGSKPKCLELETLLLSTINFPLERSKILHLANELLHTNNTKYNEPEKNLTFGWYRGFVQRHNLKEQEQIELKRQRDRPKILCFAMSFPDIAATIRYKLHPERLDPNAIGRLSRATRRRPNSKAIEQVWKGLRQGNVFDFLDPKISDDIVHLKDIKFMAENDARDMAKIIAAQQLCDCNVYTNSLQEGIAYREDRHLNANWCGSNYVRQIKHQFGCNIKFHQMVFDSCWAPVGYHPVYWPNSFFQHLPKLKELLVDPPSIDSDENNNNSNFEVGVLLYPFTSWMLYHLIDNINTLKNHYEISFGSQDELDCNALWKGTQQIPKHIMEEDFSKQKEQEEYYSKFDRNSMTQSTPPGHNADKIKQLVMSIPERRFRSLRTIRIKKLRPGEVGGFNVKCKVLPVVSSLYKVVDGKEQPVLSVGANKCLCDVCTGTNKRKRSTMMDTDTNNTTIDRSSSKVQCVEIADIGRRRRRRGGHHIYCLFLVGLHT